MQSISNLTVFNGVIPNKATQTDTEFANNIFGFLNYSGVPFVADVNTIVNQLNILSGQINTAAQETATNAENALNATATLVAGSIDDIVISGTKAYSNQKVNALFSSREDKLGANIASAASITIGTAGLGDTIHITGTTTITSLGVASAIGIRRTLIFDSALTLTHNATFLICPGNANIVTTAGTVVEVVAENTTVWRVLCVSHPSLSFAKLGYLSTITSDLQAQLNGKAPIDSPAFTNNPTAPTKDFNDNSTKLATTGYIDRAVNGGFVRQTVQFASVDSSGYANFISIGTGLSVNIAATTTNIKLNASGGLSDRNATINANTTISSLTANTTNYLYADISATGVVTLGSTTLAPIYQSGGVPSVINGQHTFNIGEMKMYIGNGSTASQTYRVFLGEVVTGASTVTGVVNYALNGRTVIISATLSVSTLFSYNHFIGVGITPIVDYALKCVVANNNWVINDEVPRWIDGVTGVSDTTVLVGVDSTTVRCNNATNYIAMMSKTTSTVVSSAITNWKMIFRINRGW